MEYIVTITCIYFLSAHKNVQQPLRYGGYITPVILSQAASHQQLDQTTYCAITILVSVLYSTDCGIHAQAKHRGYGEFFFFLSWKEAKNIN